jgi:integrase/recombinase XerC
VGNRGRRLPPRRLQILVPRLARQAKLGKHITPHSLRRTFATLLLQGGCNLKVISELMGHECLSTTAGYQQLDLADLIRIYQQAHPLAGAQGD